MKKKNKCQEFVDVHCVNGSCPCALNETYDWYSDCYDVPKGCKDCEYHEQDCDNCIFLNCYKECPDMKWPDKKE